MRNADPYVDILSSIRSINWLHKRIIDAQQGTRITMLTTLDAIQELDGGRVSQLAVRLSVDLSVISRRIAALRQKGWIELLPDPLDGRAQLVRLSHSGTATLNSLRTATSQSIAGRLEHWTAADLENLATLLRRLHSDLDRLV